jgi:hypothetical protein
MSRRSQGARTGGMMLGIFIVILIAYLSYIFLLQPWERKSLLTQESNISINVFDCDSGLPIENATVYIYSEEGLLIKEEKTKNGQVKYRDFPDCFNIKVSLTSEQYQAVCIGSGEDKVVNFCYEYPEANPQVLFFESEAGVVGGTEGEVINEQNFTNVILSYPLSNSTISYPSYYLFSNIVWSEGTNVLLRNINENLTKSVYFKFNLDSKKGDPIIKVYANNKLMFKNSVDTGSEVEVVIPRQEINETINIELKCDFNGWMFWTTQDCNLSDIKAVQEFYTPLKTSQEFFFQTSSIEQDSDIVELSFTSSTESPGGVKAFINDVEVFNNDKLEATNYSATIPTTTLGLMNAQNTLRFEANPSAEAFIRNVNLKFNTPVTGTEEKYYEFGITDDELSDLSQIVINFFVSNVYFNGGILFKVNNVYYFQVINKAGWNSAIIDKEDLFNDNTLLISAPEGRFELGNLKITYE